MENHNPGRRDFLIGFGGLTAGMAMRVSPASAQTGRSSAIAAPMFMYVGSYTSPARGHGEGLSVYSRRGTSEGWTLIQVMKDVGDPSIVIIDRRRRFLYTAHGDGTQATADRIDQATGRLTVVNQQPTAGGNGRHPAIAAHARS